MNDTSVRGIGMTSERTRLRLIERLRADGIVDEDVLSILQTIPRHLFIDEALAHRAYEDVALPIGLGQTISQPYVVAKMTELLMQHTPKFNCVLEIGTGSGYQTAILSQIFSEVYTIERVSELQGRARQRFRQLGLRNIVVKEGDGGKGWAEHAPFDAIMVTAAATTHPKALLRQLALGGVMVLPVGKQEADQELHLVKHVDGNFEVEVIEPVKFVPLVTTP